MNRKMLNVKRCFSAFLAGILIMSAVNVFAGVGNTVFYNSDYEKSDFSKEPEKGTTQLIVKANKDSFRKGENVSVDFKILNNRGFSSYGFKITYNNKILKPMSTSSKNSEVEYNYNSKVKNKAVEVDSLKSSFISEKSGEFYITGFCMNAGGEHINAEGNGTLFTLTFKAISEGSSLIDLLGYNDFILSDKDGKKLPVYVKNFFLNVHDPNKPKSEEVQNEPETKAQEVKNEPETKAQEVKNEPETKVQEVQNEPETVSENETETTAEETTYPDFQINLPNPVGPPVEFNDMAGHPWAKDAVGFLAAAGIIKGQEKRILKPSEFMTRADFMIIIKRLTGIDGQPESNIYSDVDQRAYYADAIGTITKYGLAKGISETAFGPKANITRQEVVTVLATILEKAGKLQNSDQNILDSFVDEDFVSPYARQYMADFVAMKIVSGNDKKRLNPVDPITRAEVCVLVKKVYDLLAQG